MGHCVAVRGALKTGYTTCSHGAAPKSLHKEADRAWSGAVRLQNGLTSCALSSFCSCLSYFSQPLRQPLLQPQHPATRTTRGGYRGRKQVNNALHTQHVPVCMCSNVRPFKHECIPPPADLHMYNSQTLACSFIAQPCFFGQISSLHATAHGGLWSPGLHIKLAGCWHYCGQLTGEGGGEGFRGSRAV